MLNKCSSKDLKKKKLEHWLPSKKKKKKSGHWLPSAETALHPALSLLLLQVMAFPKQ